MTYFDFREPVSAWSHATWLVLSIPATILLWRRCGDALGRRISFLIFGLSLACCYAGSAAYHGVRGSRADLFEPLRHGRLPQRSSDWAQRRPVPRHVHTITLRPSNQCPVTGNHHR